MAYEPRPTDALAVVIGANARAARDVGERKQRHVAADVGISESMLSKIEHGKALPSAHVLVRLARTLGLQPGDLFETPKVAA